jgi:S-adenosylmethionine:tRNA ribosyltransferase-isomerase
MWFMQVADFDYDLPPELIAQTSAVPRDAARLFVYDRVGKHIEHRVFDELDQILSEDVVLVLNDTRVEPRRLLGHKTKTRGNVELLLLDRVQACRWNCKVHPGLGIGQEVIIISYDAKEQLTAVVRAINDDGTRVIEFSQPVEDVWDRFGVLPIPPYIRNFSGDQKLYQTVYACVDGSVAAPTAGRHFTPALLERLHDIGIEIEYLTLHVSRDTAFPIIKEERVEDVSVHAEQVSLSAETAARLNAAKQAGKRIIAVGTTTVRTLEGIATKQRNREAIKHKNIKTLNHKNNEATKQINNVGADSDRRMLTPQLMEYEGKIDLFISPGYEFKFIDGMITNFHFPRSSLLMLVAAFAGHERLLELYQCAIEERYRFFSFGDAMLIW